MNAMFLEALWLAFIIYEILSVNTLENIKTKACIIGSGVGGLCLSSRLALQGNEVVVVEKNNRCGGRLGSEYVTVNEKAYRFDIGPSLLLLPKVYRDTFEALGERLEDHVELLEVTPFYRCFFQDAARPLDITPSLISDEIEAYMKISGSFLNFGLSTVIEERFSMKHLPSFVSACSKVFPLISHQSMLERYFSKSSLRAAMSFQNLYVGLSPYSAPAVFSLLQALEFDQGIFYPKGGFGVVSQALENIARKLGVRILLDTQVSSLNVDETSNSIHDIQASNGKQMYRIEADQYVTNIDAPQSESLLPEHFREHRTECGKPSCGVLQFHLTFNRTIEELAHHNVFFSSDYHGSWNTIDRPDDSVFNESNFNFYVHVPSRTDDSVCPRGHDAITLLIPVPPLRNDLSNSSLEDEALVRRALDAALDRIQSVVSDPNENLRRSLSSVNTRTPTTWQQEFNLFRGSAFGLSHSLDQLSIFRPRLRHQKVSNLFRVGASTRPGNGVPLVMIGSRLTAEAMLHESYRSNGKM